MLEQATMEMPKYEHKKIAWALKIKEITIVGVFGFGRLVPEDSRYSPFNVNAEYIEHYEPEIGGYYVKYEGGYADYKPAVVFETQFTRISE